ncbi:MAG: RibD family protein [Chthonomonadales bacterium]
MAIERLFDAFDADTPPQDLYTRIEFPPAPLHRPYVFMNMVATVDGKTLQGPRGSTAKGLGSATDQLLMRRLQGCADAAILGAGTLRVGHVEYPPHLWRVVVTSSGDLPIGNRFFTDGPHRVIVIAPETLVHSKREALRGAGFHLVLLGQPSPDLREAAKLLRAHYSIERLLLEGGATLNFSFLEAGLVDELFLTLAPKLKGGASLPTVVDGPGLPGNQVRLLQLVSAYRDHDELYLRYRMAEDSIQGAQT